MKYRKKTIGPQEISTTKQYVYDVLAGEREPKPMESATASVAGSICLKGFELLEKIEKSQPKATRASTARRSNNARLLKKNIELKTIEYLDEDPNLTTKDIAKKLGQKYSRAEKYVSRFISPIVKNHRKSWSGNK